MTFQSIAGSQFRTHLGDDHDVSLSAMVDRPAQEKYVPSLAQKRSARQAANHASPGERPKNAVKLTIKKNHDPKYTM